MKLSLTKKRVLFIVISLVVVSLAHYFTSTELWYYHNIYQKLYYIAIFTASFWFGLKGGMLTALAASILYLPHIIFQWGGMQMDNLSQFLELGLYNIIGFITGYLSEQEKKERRLHEKTAKQLDILYTRLKDQTKQLVAASEAIRRADRLSTMGALSASLAHEIRNPLGAIKGTIQILGDKIKPQDKEYEFLGILDKEIDRLNTVVTKYLDFARPSEGELVEVDINTVLEGTLSLVSPQLKKLNVILQENITKGIPLLAINSAQLEQAFLNLIMNAVQAMPDGGALTVSTELTNDEICCSISNIGKGISPEEGKNIFSPFFTTKENGTGLGLFIVKKIVEANNGRINWESEIGKKTTFNVCFPKVKKS